MKKFLALFFLLFSGKIMLAQSSTVCMQFGWEQMHLKWQTFENIADTFNSTHTHLVNYMDTPRQLKGPLYMAEAQLAGRLFSYGGIGFASARYKYTQDDSLGNEIRNVRFRTRNIWISAGLEFFLIKSKYFKISLASGLDFANLHTGANERATLRFGTLNENFIVGGRFFVNFFFGHKIIVGLKPYYLLPFYSANFYPLDKYLNPDSAANSDKSHFKQNTKTYGLMITIGGFQLSDDI